MELEENTNELRQSKAETAVAKKEQAAAEESLNDVRVPMIVMVVNQYLNRYVLSFLK